MSVTIHPATLRDMTYIAVNMREADRREIHAVFPGTDTAIGSALHEASPGLAWTAWHGGRPVCAFGIARLFPGLGSGWAYGTRAMPSTMKPVTRFCLRKAAPKLLREGFRRVEVRSAIDHDLSHRWLEHLGFQREGIARDYGSEGLDFVTYAATRNREPVGPQASSLPPSTNASVPRAGWKPAVPGIGRVSSVPTTHQPASPAGFFIGASHEQTA